MENHTQVARDILQQLLAAGPQKGARLKPLLMQEFQARTGTAFTSVFWNYQKFSDFLKANSDVVEITAPVGPGDILVALRRTNAASTPLHQAQLAPGNHSPTFYLPKPLWHAFTNPDPKRRRFFHRHLRNVLHFLEGSDGESNARATATVQGDSNFVEISPVRGEQQIEWMKEFIASIELSPQRKEVADTLARGSFSSQLNATFVAALGESAPQWNRFRAARVQQHVDAWARKQGLSLADLGPKVMGPAPVPAPLANPADGAAASDLRRLLHEAIDALQGSELPLVMIPATALLRIASHRAR